MKRWILWIAASALLCSAYALHQNDLLFGVQNGTLVVVQPQPHSVRTMSSVPGAYLLDVGMDFFYEGDIPQLQSCRVVQVWISPGLMGTRSGIGTLFCASGCPNLFDLPTNGTPHHHFIFGANSPGVYVWDLRAIDGVAANGTPVADMTQVYRIYMVAGNPLRLFGDVQPASEYQGDLYNLSLTVQLRRNGNPVATSSLPPNPDAIYPYMVGFNQPSGTYTVVAKLSKHLSRRVDSLTLSGATRADWQFPYVGDLNDDDQIDDADLLQVLFAFGQAGANLPEDVNGDGVVDDADLLTVLFNFGRVGEGTQP
jgi:hypothetical protein